MELIVELIGWAAIAFVVVVFVVGVGIVIVCGASTEHRKMFESPDYWADPLCGPMSSPQLTDWDAEIAKMRRETEAEFKADCERLGFTYIPPEERPFIALGNVARDAFGRIVYQQGDGSWSQSLPGERQEKGEL